MWIAVDSWSTGVDSAAESKYPNLYSCYAKDDIGFGLEAAVFPKPEDAALEDMFEVFLNDVILTGKIDVEVISQEQERLDDDRLRPMLRYSRPVWRDSRFIKRCC